MSFVSIKTYELLYFSATFFIVVGKLKGLIVLFLNDATTLYGDAEPSMTVKAE